MTPKAVSNLFYRLLRGWRLGLFLLLHVIASYYYISRQSITFDEPQYIEYAKHWLHGKPERVEVLDDSKSPIIAICWLPRIARQLINPGYHLTDYGRKDQEEGRHMMILFSLITAVYVYKWCRLLYGKSGWQMPLLLLLFDPLYLAYSTLITTDLACGTFLVALLYHFRKYLVTSERKQLYIAAVCTALGIVTKQNMLFALLLLPVLHIIYHLLSRKQEPFFTRRTLTDSVIFCIIIITFINIAYYFHRTFIPFGNYIFESHTLQNLQQHLGFLHRLPVPLPEAYVQSIDMIKAHAEVGAGKPQSTYNGVYLFGELKLQGSFWYYYLVLLWYKMPVGTMLLVAASVPLFFKKFRLQNFSEYLFILLPVIYYGVILSFFNQFQIGIRHILLVFPLVYIGLGKLFYEVARARLAYKIAAGFAVAYTFISVAIYYPYLIPYTNEFITDKKTVYKKMMDSSIDYGQSAASVAGFIAQHSGYKTSSPVPDTGRFAITIDHVFNTYFRDKNVFKWYQKFEPEGLYRYDVLLYHIKEDDLLKAGLSKPGK